MSVEKERDKAISHLSQEKEKVPQLQQDGRVAEQDLNASRTEVITLKKHNIYRRLKRKEDKLEQMSEQVKNALERIAYCKPGCGPRMQGTKIRRCESEGVASDTEKQTDTGAARGEENFVG